MSPRLPIHLVLYAQVLTRVLHGAPERQQQPALCTAAVIEDTGTNLNPRNDIVLLSYRPRDNMYDAALREFQVK